MESHAFEILEILKQLGLTPLNIVLLGMVYVLMAHIGIVDKFWLSKEKKQEERERSSSIVHVNEHTGGKGITTVEEITNGFKVMQESILRLSQYYNHDTTRHQNETNKTLAEMNRTLSDIKVHFERSQKQESENNNLLKEIKEYGVKCRRD